MTASTTLGAPQSEVRRHTARRYGLAGAVALIAMAGAGAAGWLASGEDAPPRTEITTPGPATVQPETIASLHSVTFWIVGSEREASDLQRSLDDAAQIAGNAPGRDIIRVFSDEGGDAREAMAGELDLLNGLGVPVTISDLR